jgi:HK97 family phage prohead protease
MLHKSFTVLETKTDNEAGTFEATVAIFGNVDRGGDRIMPGAFAKTLDAWKASGDPIPVILSHQWDNPMAHIGVVQDAKETEKGLWVKGALDVADNDVARQVHRLMQRRSLKEFSFGYDVPKGGEKRAKDGANELHQLDLAEVGPTLKGMNPATELHAVKSALVEDKLQTELQEVKARLEKLEKALEDQETQVGGGDGQGAKARSVDPLRKQADAIALDVTSGGVSPQPPNRHVAEPPPEPDRIDLKELRRQSREVMLQVLSGMEP